MSDTLVLHANERKEVGSANGKKVRAEGKVPGVVYGRGKEAVSLSIDANALARAFAEAGESTIITLDVDGKKHNVIIHDYQRDALGQKLTHVDFYEVKMDEEISAEVELVFEGVAPAEKNLGGVVIKNITQLEVKALPQNLPHHIVVDFSSLATFDDVIRVADIQIPSGVEVVRDAEDVIVSVTQPRSEAELESLDTEIVENVEQVEVTGQKEETEAPAEEK